MDGLFTFLSAFWVPTQHVSWFGALMDRSTKKEFCVELHCVLPGDGATRELESEETVALTRCQKILEQKVEPVKRGRESRKRRQAAVAYAATQKLTAERAAQERLIAAEQKARRARAARTRAVTEALEKANAQHTAEMSALQKRLSGGSTQRPAAAGQSAPQLSMQSIEAEIQARVEEQVKAQEQKTRAEAAMRAQVEKEVQARLKQLGHPSPGRHGGNGHYTSLTTWPIQGTPGSAPLAVPPRSPLSGNPQLFELGGAALGSTTGPVLPATHPGQYSQGVQLALSPQDAREAHRFQLLTQQNLIMQQQMQLAFF
jgi:hypothetical protein